MKLVILDRDGTINFDSEDFVKSEDEWVAMPGALEAIARLNHAGWRVVLAMNQPGLGRGLFEMAALNRIHAKMHKQLAAHGGRIDAVFFCPHAPDEGCACRKPRPGLFEQIRERYGVDAKDVPAAGDGLRDAQAAAAAGCEVHLLLTGQGAALRESLARGEPLPASYPQGTRVHDDLPAFAAFLLAREERRQAAAAAPSAPPAASIVPARAA
ncbi:MAG: Histidinol-phosphatase [Burkholderiaceae bacterium]|jgi:D-glycero-D-manno-heptose 1,7-bisphosphate phosphatase|nr:MAG: Histidinol-phosphatase [Burkholderiaceae bacterium]